MRQFLFLMDVPHSINSQSSGLPQGLMCLLLVLKSLVCTENIHHTSFFSFFTRILSHILFPTSHTESASRTQWPRRRGWRPAACAPGICSSVSWAQSGRWSWCGWASRCSCRRRSAALCCAAGWSCAPSTSGGTSAPIAAAPSPSGPRRGGWKRRAELRKRSWRGGSPPSMRQQDGWHRPTAPEWSQEPCGCSWQCASPPGCFQWQTAERWRRTVQTESERRKW